MDNKNIVKRQILYTLLTALIVVIIMGVGFYLYLNKNYTGKLCDNPQVEFNLHMTLSNGVHDLLDMYHYHIPINIKLDRDTIITLEESKQYASCIASFDIDNNNGNILTLNDVRYIVRVSDNGKDTGTQFINDKDNNRTLDMTQQISNWILDMRDKRNI